MMTDTTVTERVLASTWPGHFNKPLAEALTANIKRVGMPEWSEADQKLAHAAQKELNVGADGPEEDGHRAARRSSAAYRRRLRRYLRGLLEPAHGRAPLPGEHPRHDRTPLVGGHRLATPIAHKGSTAGAKAHVLTALDLLLKPELLKAAREYFAKQTKDIKWKPLVPDFKPPVELNADKMERFKPELKKLRYDPEKYGTYMEQLGIQYPTVK